MDAAQALNDFEGPDRVIKCIYSDGAPEFKKMCRKHRTEGVAHDVSTPYRHTAGAKIERRNRLVLDGTRTALERSGLGHVLWPRAVRHFCFAYNTRHIDREDNPYFKRHGRKCLAKAVPFGA